MKVLPTNVVLPVVVTWTAWPPEPDPVNAQSVNKPSKIAKVVTIGALPAVRVVVLNVQLSNEVLASTEMVLFPMGSEVKAELVTVEPESAIVVLPVKVLDEIVAVVTVTVVLFAKVVPEIVVPPAVMVGLLVSVQLVRVPLVAVTSVLAVKVQVVNTPLVPATLGFVLKALPEIVHEVAVSTGQLLKDMRVKPALAATRKVTVPLVIDKPVKSHVAALVAEE